MEADDAKGRPTRAERLQELLQILPAPSEGMIVHGGDLSMMCFDEIRRCYLDGSHLASVLLCLAFAERELAAQLYAAGWESASKAPLNALVENAYQDNMLSDQERHKYRELAELRNSHAHFRAPQTNTALIARSVEQNALSEEILAEDARRALIALSSIIKRSTVPSIDMALTDC